VRVSSCYEISSGVARLGADGLDRAEAHLSELRCQLLAYMSPPDVVTGTLGVSSADLGDRGLDDLGDGLRLGDHDHV
jgi:hypothetical protein